MAESTTPKRSRADQCRYNAQEKSEKKRQATFTAVLALQKEGRPITKAAVAKRAGVSTVFLRTHPDLLQAIEQAESRRPMQHKGGTPTDTGKDQVIAALRRRVDELKQALEAKERHLRDKQRELDRLYGKLAAGSPLTDAELRQQLTDALQRLDVLAAPARE
jgi:predicted ArsR family transcriptional regulator